MGWSLINSYALYRIPLPASHGFQEKSPEQFFQYEEYCRALLTNNQVLMLIQFICQVHHMVGLNYEKSHHHPRTAKPRDRRWS